MGRGVSFMMQAPIKLAFPLIGRGTWTGGYVYLKNTLRLIQSRLKNEIQPFVFLSPEENEKYGQELSPLAEGRLIVDPSIGYSGRGSSLAEAILTGRDRKLELLLKSHGIQVVFEIASFYGARFGIPVVAWMPDYQHRHMPEMFTRSNWWRRDLGFRMQIRSGRTLMLSSETARNDMEKFYPKSRGRGHVVRFAIDLDIKTHIGQGPAMCKKYDLPNRFFYLPNQFWKHKNHATIIEALTLLKRENKLDSLPPIILSGLNKDIRNPSHFDDLMHQVNAAGIESNFRFLGLIPYSDVLNLAGSCDTLINPSFFEGWSTPIEEAKALGAPLLLSDIPLHREQAPDAVFADPKSSAAFSVALLKIGSRTATTRKPTSVLVENQELRLSQHSQSLLKTVQDAARNAIK